MVLPLSPCMGVNLGDADDRNMCLVFEGTGSVGAYRHCLHSCSNYAFAVSSRVRTCDQGFETILPRHGTDQLACQSSQAAQIMHSALSSK